MVPARLPGPHRIPRPLYLGAALVGVGLLLAGIAGRQAAVREAQVMEIVTLRDQLQQRLEFAYTVPAEIQAQGPNQAVLTDLLVRARDLEARVFRVPRKPQPGSVPGAWDLELDLATATAANATGHFASALQSLEAYDEKGAWALIPDRLGRADDLLQVRADSLFGLERWREAADRYRQIVERHPARAGVGLRLAECRFRTGERAKALSLLEASARTLQERATRELQEGQFALGVSTLERALPLFRRLCDQEGQIQLDREHVAVLTSLAWVYAAAPAPGIRNAPRAREHAEAACKISRWQSLAAVEALAAAHAEARDFPEAARVQSKALNLAPPAQRARIQSTLDRYTAAGGPTSVAPAAN
ncbi:MAG: tetratricopeptide repeat protein [Verrucomicrobia bacterium]|nr:tetratricopeptide repeat protein [Verrucomicrobiota bacterium]